MWLRLADDWRELLSLHQDDPLALEKGNPQEEANNFNKIEDENTL